MRMGDIKRVAEKISKKYGMPMPIVEKIKGACGDDQVEIRGELTSDEGGNEMSGAISKINPDYICENQGGCVYRVYELQ
jgi:uncharacterized protein YutD